MGEPHHKPTKEELKIQEAEALAEVEKLEKEPEKVEEPEEEPEVAEETKPQQDSPPFVEETPATQVEEDKKQEPQADPSKELYKKKFSESSRENQKIYAKNRVITKALVDADDVAEPTEEELVKEYPDWDIATENERIALKEALISKRFRTTIAQAKEQATKIEKWNDSVDEFIENPITLNENPDLEGKQEEFRIFAKQEAHNSVPYKLLVSAFLHDYSTTKKVNKGKMFEKGLGGANERVEPKGDTLTLEEARILRETNYPLWKEKLMAGKIKSDL